MDLMISFSRVFGGGAEPLRITEYTSGTGTHQILPESNYQIVKLVGAGGDGGTGYTSGSNFYGVGGNGGDELYRRTSLSGAVTYEVGARGRPGGNTKLGYYVAKGGAGGNNGSTTNGTVASVDTTAANGLTPGTPATVRVGGNSALGIGGGTSGNNGLDGTGYGAGGGGALGSTGTAGKGTGGHIRIEEY